jgi:hypothetical protein
MKFWLFSWRTAPGSVPRRLELQGAGRRRKDRIIKSLSAFFSDDRTWIGLSGLGWLASLAALVVRGQTISLPIQGGVVIPAGPGMVHFLVAGAGLLAAIFILRRRWRPWLAKEKPFQKQ